MTAADKIAEARALIGFADRMSDAALRVGLAGTSDWDQVAGAADIYRVQDTVAALADLAEAQVQENAKLRGLLWYARHEFNAIRARDGAPRASCCGCLGPALVSEEWWNTLTEAFGEAIGKEALTPWPSPEAKAVAADLVIPQQGDDVAAQEELACTCGAGHGSLEGHTDWCDCVARTARGDTP